MFSVNSRYVSKKTEVREASWFCVPYLNQLKNDGVLIYHKVRNPVDQIRSWVTVEATSAIKKPASVFAERNCGFNYWELSLPERAARFWVSWNSLIHSYCHRRWRVEDVSREIITDVFNETTIVNKLKTLPTNVNHKRRIVDVDFSQITSETKKAVIELAKAYGYGEPALSCILDTSNGSP